MCVFCHIMSGTCGKICLPSTRHQVSKTEVYLFFAISSNPALDAIPEDGVSLSIIWAAQRGLAAPTHRRRGEVDGRERRG